MALLAIYGDDLCEFEKKGGLRYFQIYIRYDLPDGTEVRAKLSSANENLEGEVCPDDGTEDNGNEFSYICNVEYLPPLILTCLLPRSYPSKDPPYFTITARWMDGPNVTQLCEMLDTIWAELPGQEVIYQWVEWLHNSSLAYLWCDSKITLGLDVPMQRADNCAISRSLPLKSVIPSMLSYSSKKRYQAFLEDLHMCMICLNQSKGSNFIELPCQHLFCVKCMETLCRMHVKEGSVFKLICPETKCSSSIPPYLLKRLLSKEEFERWDRLTLQKALDSMSDVVYCPRCGIGCLEDEDKNAQCPKCSFIFCSSCKDPRHLGKQCLTLEQKLQHPQKSRGMIAREMVEQMLSIRKLYGDAIFCPNCGIAISRTEGCNIMLCGNCYQSFCFRCGKASCRSCDLYAPRENEQTDWQRRMEKLEKENRVAQRHPVGSIVKCPKCRQRNFKGDDKYIFCWSCRFSYCTLCKKRIEFTGPNNGHWGSLECVGLGNMM
ncbi:uncharacterized protein [Lolium perenne]|uniref:uncharacterized protein n=1 Tax=Lolium perenne TaxID=4522 RepID=UPI0021F5E591|nr:uncharacterized protein LOC127292945 [Lolium perenne]